MGTRIRIPALLDLLILSEAEEILGAADHPALDRGPLPHGPLLNHLIAGIPQQILKAPGGSLPAALPRGDAARAEAQHALAARLSAPAPWDEDSLDAVAAWLRGRKPPLGPACQQLVGRLFVPDFRARQGTWHAATVLQRALTNPGLRLLWTVTGEISRAQQILSEAVGGDRSGVHAIGIAVHSLVRAVERLEAVWADPTLRAMVSNAGALGHAVSAPDTVLRHANAYADLPGGAGGIAPGTLVLFRLDAEANRLADPRLAFLSESWSACPASSLVPRLLAEIWARATGADIPFEKAA